MTTTATIPGYDIERVIGLVEAGSWTSFQSVRARLTRQAERAGANAVVGVHYAGGRPTGFSGCILYGTAVVIRPDPPD